MPALNYTTKVPADRTIGECQAILGRAGAASVSVHFEAGQPAGLSFALDLPGRRWFRLPVDVKAMHALLQRQEAAGQLRAGAKQARGTFTSSEHAARVAWRVVKDWLEAQVALIEAQQAGLDQVMLPYLLTDPDGGRTLYEVFAAREFGELPA